MTDLNKTIIYAFKLEDNVTSTARNMSEATEEAGKDIDDLNAKQQQAQMEADQTKRKLDSQQLSVLTQLTAMMGLREAVSATTSGLIGLGVVSDETAQDLNKINAAFSIFAGAVTTLKSVQAVMTTLNGATAVNAALNAFNAVLQSPAKLAVVSLAAGAAIGAAGSYLITNNNSSSSTTNIHVDNTTPKQAQTEIFQIVGGGAL